MSEEKLTFEKVWAALMESREQFRETRERFQETDRLFKETDKKIKEIWQQLGGIGKSNGEMAENYFYNSFEQSKKFGVEQFDYIEANVKGRTNGFRDEYDIVLYNGKSVGIIEVKYNAKKTDVTQTINKPTTFRQLFPQYADFTFYLGLASFAFEKDVEQTALEAGIAVIKQVGENMVVLDDRVKKF